MAHTEVYGYGFRPYEFSSLSHGTVGGAAGNVSLYRQRELELGMHGMRSALYPTFYVIVSCLADIVGLDVRPFVVRYEQNGSVCVVCLFRFVVFVLLLCVCVCVCVCVCDSIITGTCCMVPLSKTGRESLTKLIASTSIDCFFMCSFSST